MLYVFLQAALILTVLASFDVTSAERVGRCPINETFHDCGRQCEDRCTGPRPEICKTTAMKNCENKGCRCSNNFVRNPYSGRCIRPEHCPEDGCAPGEFADLCGRQCEGTCENTSTPKTCDPPRCKNRGCRCDLDGGYVRNTRLNKCVRISKCGRN